MTGLVPSQSKENRLTDTKAARNYQDVSVMSSKHICARTGLATGDSQDIV